MVEEQSLGRRLPLAGSCCHPPASLPLVGDGLVCTLLALLWYSLSPLFCEWALQCLRLELFMGQFSLSFCYLFIFSSQLCYPLGFQNFPQTRGERVPWCLETSPSRLPPQDGSLSLTLLSLFLSFVFCPTSFRREWAAFLGAWCSASIQKLFCGICSAFK